MKVLVTGGAGFVGTNLIKRLLEDGHQVTSIDNYHTGKKSNHIDGVEYIEDDISQKGLGIITWKPYDIVFHMAAVARIQPSFKNPVGYFNVNAVGTLKVVEYCVKNNVPLIFAGSSSHHSGRFKNPYTFSKDIGEDIIKLYQEHFNLKCSIARFYNVYGPYHLKEGGYTTLIGAWEKLIEEDKPLVIYGDGSKRRDFTHVDDIVNGLIKIMDKQSWGHVFEFGRGQNYSVNEIADMFGKERVYQDDKTGEAQVTLCDYTKARIILGWEPKKNIKEYIKDYLSR